MSKANYSTMKHVEENRWLGRTECPGCGGIFGERYLADHMLACVYLKHHAWSADEAALAQRLDGLMVEVRRVRAMKDAIDIQVAGVASDIQAIRERAAKEATHEDDKTPRRSSHAIS